ncbi:WXG100 family type VII secretion target [Paenibacillus sp. JX-17]|uniref:WXG100 family type VII secretion target n=1 Tax=Paenibacillus lacisoli TaxID=3064525 RepID=A0ABT9C8M4_9BACL|nr:WXG100 family type VII secretion target [Paenibacillus sp. JX-17]MDO7905602.1 WXG100 family type VII secretion target [Paenibacillus sp. JX-17]
MSKRILVTPKQLLETSSRFSQAEGESSELIQGLERSLLELESIWEGVTKEQFYGQYIETKDRMQTFVQSLHSVSSELNKIAVKYDHADRQDSSAAVGQAVPVMEESITSHTAAAGATSLFGIPAVMKQTAVHGKQGLQSGFKTKEHNEKK